MILAKEVLEDCALVCRAGRVEFVSQDRLAIAFYLVHLNDRDVACTACKNLF